MQIMKEYSYKIFSSRNDEELCDAYFRFLQHSNSDLPESGKIEVTLKYEDPNLSFNPNNSYKYPEKWEKGSGTQYRMHIVDFNLPPALRKEGVGLFIWSEIRNNLPSAVGANLRISGLLSRIDAKACLIDEKRRFIRGSTVNNIESRNRFWRKLLSHGPNGEPISFQCNANGDGTFSGWLKDPLLDKENHRPRNRAT